jgi:hypothetical protein
MPVNYAKLNRAEKHQILPRYRVINYFGMKISESFGIKELWREAKF